MADHPVLRVPVYRRFSDLDPLGHVNNVVFHDYLQEARVGMLHDIGFVRGPGFSQVVVKQEITHRKPLLLAREPVIIETWVEHLGNSSYTFRYRILDEHGDVAAEASSVMAVVDPETGRPIRIHPELRAVLAATHNHHVTIRLAEPEARALEGFCRRQLRWDESLPARVVTAANALGVFTAPPLGVLVFIAVPTVDPVDEADAVDAIVSLGRFADLLRSDAVTGMRPEALPQASVPVGASPTLQHLPPTDGWQLPIFGVSGDLVPVVDDATAEFEGAHGWPAAARPGGRRGGDLGASCVRRAAAACAARGPPARDDHDRPGQGVGGHLRPVEAVQHAPRPGVRVLQRAGRAAGPARRPLTGLPSGELTPPDATVRGRLLTARQGQESRAARAHAASSRAPMPMARSSTSKVAECRSRRSALDAGSCVPRRT